MSNTVPILVTAYNRPFLLQQCLDRLKNVSNPIYISIDGAKPGNFGDQKLVTETIEIASNFLKVDNRLIINSENLGLSRAVTSAVSRVLSLHSTIIVVEDDILLTEDSIFFFENCLLRFEHEPSIAAITALNYVPKEFITDTNSPYRLSNYAESWGWATWATRWESFPISSLVPLKYLKTPKEIRSISTWVVWRKIFNKVAKGELNSWAYRWMYVNWQMDRQFLASNLNLATNIGFGNEATNTSKSINIPHIETLDRDKLLSWPKPALDNSADNWLTRKHFRTNLLSRIYFLVVNTVLKRKR